MRRIEGIVGIVGMVAAAVPAGARAQQLAPAGRALARLVRAVPAPSGAGALGLWFRGRAIGIVIATPFLVLVLLAALERGRRLGWYAAGTLLIALIGILLVG